MPALELLDQLLVQANAKRVEIDAIKVVQQGGRTDAAALGRELVTLHLDDVPVFDALEAIEPKLHLPIARDVKPNQLPGPTNVGGELYVMTAKGDPNPEYVPHVTLHVTNVTAGAALEQLLEQTGLGFVETTGYSIVPR